jgi:hypothetical protein
VKIHFCPGRVASWAALAFLVGCGGGDDSVAPAPDSGVDGAALDGTTASDALADGGDASLPPSGDGAVADSGGGIDAGSDASGDSGDSGDSAVDADLDAPSRPDAPSGLVLGCTTWRFASPVVIEELGGADAGSVSYNSNVWVASPVGEVRIFAQPTDGPAFRLYGFDRSTNAVTTLDAPGMAETSITSVHPFALGASNVNEVLLQDESAVPAPANELVAYLVDDAMPMTGPLPGPIALSIGFGSAVAVPFDTTTVFDAVDYIESSEGVTLYYGLGVALTTSSQAATLSPVALSANAGDFNDLAAVHANGNVYVFASNAVSHAGESVWGVPDDAGVTDPFAPRAFDTGENGRMIDVAPSADAGSINMAYIALPEDGGGNTLLATQVTPSALDSVTQASLALSRSYDDGWLASAAATAVWHGDDLMIIGPASLGGGASASGVRLLWVDAQGTVHGEQMGTASLLQDRTGIVSVAASPSSVTATTATWDVAWIESHVDGTSSLLYNELDCQ